jgi:hypothetical protein
VVVEEAASAVEATCGLLDSHVHSATSACCDTWCFELSRAWIFEIDTSPINHGTFRIHRFVRDFQMGSSSQSRVSPRSSVGATCNCRPGSGARILRWNYAKFVSVFQGLWKFGRGPTVSDVGFLILVDHPDGRNVDSLAARTS